MLDDSKPANDADELPELTDKQQKFVNARLAGATKADAVRAATDTSGWKPSSIWTEAAKLSQNPKVRRWLEALNEACLETALTNQAEHLAQLARIRERSLSERAHNAALQAEVKRGEVCGLYVTRVADVTEHSPEHTLRRIHSISPQLATAIAAQNNIPWQIAEEPQSQTAH